jgi:hypothetical protein
LIVVSVFSDPRQHVECDRRERLGFSARLDDDHARPRDRHHARRRLRAGDRDVDAQTAIGRFPPQLFANRPHVAKQTIEAAHVDDDEIAEAFVPWRELLRYNGQR